jgi:hypothetical protein
MPVIPALSLTITPATGLYTVPVPDAQINTAITNREGRTEIVLDFTSVGAGAIQGEGLYARDFGTTFSWPIASGTILNVWQPTAIELPENIYNRASDWQDGGTTSNKLIQGYQIEADSFGVAKTFALQDSDTLAIHALSVMPATFTKQSIKYFACVTPFQAHSVRRVTSDGVAWRVFNEGSNSNIISVPFPESQTNWYVELTSLGGEGWQHLEPVMNVEYISTTPIILTFTVDAGNGSIAPQTITIPSSGGLQTKMKLELTYNKWKIIGFDLAASAPFNLFAEGVEVKVRSWGDSGPARLVKPWGGSSSAGATV